MRIFRTLPRSLAPAVALTAVLLVAAPALPASAADAGAAPSPLLVVLDASGSMWGQVGGENKIVIARRVLADLAAGLPDDARVGLVAYGHRREGDCADIETVLPLAPLDRAALRSSVDGLNPKGKTPITAALRHAFDALGAEVGGATVILVSDGLETCGGDPCAAVRAAREAGAEILLHVVAFDVADEDVSQLECAAQAGGGLFFSAEDADQLADALDAAVAMPPEVPAGALVVLSRADGELQDAAVRVRDAASGDEVAGARTYAHAETNPRRIPLADGAYAVEVKAVGLEGDVTRAFEVEIADGASVERQVDYSSGELSVGVTRNGELSDATVQVSVAGSGEKVDAGRTYRAASSNPKTFRLTAGTYDVEVASVEVQGRPKHRFEGVMVSPGEPARLSHDFSSATVRLGARRGGELQDAAVRLVDPASGRAVAQGRTYVSGNTNPRQLEVPPGTYRAEIDALGKQDTAPRTREITVGAGDTVEWIEDFGS